MPLRTSWMRVSLVEPPVTLLVLSWMSSLISVSTVFPIRYNFPGNARLEVLELGAQVLLRLVPQGGGLLRRV